MSTVGVLFDIDGTLVDIAPGIRAGVAELHATGVSDLSFDALLNAWIEADRRFDPEAHPGTDQGLLRRARLRDVFGQGIGDSACDELYEAYRRAQERQWKLFDDVLPCLDTLEDVAIGIVSNGEGSQQRAKLLRTGIAERFRCTLVSAEVGVSKPDALIFIKACHALGMDPGNIFYIGDRYETDALGARRAGLRGVWLDRYRVRNQGHESPAISLLSELPNLVRYSGP